MIVLRELCHDIVVSPFTYSLYSSLEKEFYLLATVRQISYLLIRQIRATGAFCVDLHFKFKVISIR